MKDGLSNDFVVVRVSSSPVAVSSDDHHNDDEDDADADGGLLLDGFVVLKNQEPRREGNVKLSYR